MRSAAGDAAHVAPILTPRLPAQIRRALILRKAARIASTPLHTTVHTKP